MKVLVAMLLLLGISVAQERTAGKTFYSEKAKQDITVAADADSEFWRNVRPVYMESTPKGESVGKLKTEVRSQWTEKFIYFLFICPFDELYLKPDPNPTKETYELWNWNVAEVFLGSDFKNIKRYNEFEISPHGEWIDLDIDLTKPHHEEGWVWNSGFEHTARIDSAKHTWYAVMKIPFSALGVAPHAGVKFRANLFRTEGPPAKSHEIVWQPTMSETFHVPERFGILELAGGK